MSAGLSVIPGGMLAADGLPARHPDELTRMMSELGNLPESKRYAVLVFALVTDPDLIRWAMAKVEDSDREGVKAKMLILQDGAS